MNLGYNPNSNSRLTVVDLSDNTQVNSGGSTNTQTLTPPTGSIYIIRKIYYSAAAPVGDTSGTHQLEAKRVLVSTARSIFLVKGNHSTSVKIDRTHFTGDSAEVPSADRDQLNLIHRGDIIASNSYPIQFIYTNTTDANQTGTRTLEILVEVQNEL